MTVRIGVVGDTHCSSADQLPASVMEALAGSDLIAHLGDINVVDVLDRLETIAPVVAVPGDSDEVDRRVDTSRVRRLDIAGLNVFVVRMLSESGIPPGAHVVLHGGTHDDEIALRDGVLLVNPGSTRFAKRRPSVAIVTIREGEVTAEVVPLAAARA